MRLIHSILYASLLILASLHLAAQEMSDAEIDAMLKAEEEAEIKAYAQNNEHGGTTMAELLAGIKLDETEPKE